MSRFGNRLVPWIFCVGLAGAAHAADVQQKQDADLRQRLDAGLQLRAAGRYQEAQRFLGDLLQDGRRREPGSVFVASVLDSLGATEQDLANYQKSEQLIEEALAQLRAAGAKDSSDFAVVTGHLGEVYLEEARYREAEPVLRRSLAMLQTQEAAGPEKIAVAILDLGMACEHNKKTKEAEQLFRQALAILEARFGPDHPMLAAVLGPLSTVLIRTGRYDEALQHLEHAWHILNGNPSVGEPDRLNTLSSLGTLYSLMHRFPEAESYSKQAVTRAESIYGPEHPRLAYYLRAYGDVLKRENHTAEAKALEKRSSAIFAHQAETNPVWHTVNVNALR